MDAETGDGQPRIDGLTSMLDRIEAVADEEEAEDDTVSLADIRREIGHHAFGPFLLLIGLIVMSPIGGIPSVPTVAALCMLLLVGQLLVGRKEFWLPRFISQRSVSPQRLRKAVGYLRPVARWTETVVRRRLPWLAAPPVLHGIALACIAIALVMPFLEVVPFANTSTAAAISAFGLGLVADDGVVILLAFVFTALSFWLLAAYMF